MKILLLFLWAAAGHAAPSDPVTDLFVPGMGNAVRAQVDYRAYDRGRAAGQSFALQQSRASLGVPFAVSENDAWRAGVFSEYDAIASGAAFPTGRLMPNRLWDLGASVGYTRSYADKRTLATNLALSSASERPFTALRDLGFHLSVNYKVPSGEKNAWLYFLSVANNRSFLNYLPLPGVAYFYGIDPRLRMLVGLPILWLYWVPLEPLTVSLFYLPVRNAELKISFGSPRGFQPYTLIKYQTRNYRLSDRPEGSAERLFFDEGVAQAGVNFPVSRGLFADLGVGWSFDRRYYLATKATQRSGSPEIRPDQAAYLSLKVSGAF